MSTPTIKETQQFGLALPKKILFMAVPLLLSVLIILASPILQGVLGTILFIGLGILLGLVTFFISAGWSFRLEMTATELIIRDRNRTFPVPLDRIGMLVKNGGFPFPTLWLILRNSSLGQDIPAKGVDPKTRELIEAYQKRNPGKKLTYMPVPGGYLQSIQAFVGELKRRIPPLTVDERLGGN